MVTLILMVNTGDDFVSENLKIFFYTKCRSRRSAAGETGPKKLIWACGNFAFFPNRRGL